MIKILLVDDNPILMEGLSKILANNEEIALIGYANNIQDCLDKIELTEPDIVLTAIQIQNESGIDLCRSISKKYPTVKVVAYSDLRQKSWLFAMIRNGGWGYILKTTPLPQLLNAIKKVMRGEEYFSQKLYRFLLRRPRQNDKSNNNNLTKREKEIVSLIYNEMTSQEIAKKLFVSISTVETHRMNAISKLDARNTAGLIKNAIRYGYIEAF